MCGTCLKCGTCGTYVRSSKWTVKICEMMSFDFLETLRYETYVCSVWKMKNGILCLLFITQPVLILVGKISTKFTTYGKLWPESTEFNFSFSKRNRRMFRPSVSYSPHGAPHIRPTFLNTFHTFHSLTFHKQETILNKFVIIQNYILWFLTIVFPKV